jgi:hypothetical protein
MSPVAAQRTDEWNAAVACGVIRLAAGTVLLRWAPRLARLAGARDDDRVVPAMLRGFGARDLSLGVHSLAATRPGGDPKRAMRVQAAADVIDGAFVVGAVATGRLPRGRGIGCVVVAVLSALGLLAGAHQLEHG